MNNPDPLSVDKQLSILSIDEDATIQSLIGYWLKAAGYRVLLASSYGEAGAILKGLKPALILLDVMMPEMDGYTLCHKLKQDERLVDVPVVFLTTRTNELDRARAFAAGGVDCISKAEAREKLIPTVEKHIKTGIRWAQLRAAAPKKLPDKARRTFAAFKEFLSGRLNPDGKEKEAVNSLAAGSLYNTGQEGLPPPLIAKYLAEYFSVPYISSIDPARLRLDALPTSFCRKNRVVPADNGSGEVVFILSDPFNLEVEDMLRQLRPPGEPLRLSITEPENIAEAYMERAFTNDAVVYDQLSAVESQDEIIVLGEAENNVREAPAVTSPVIALANSIIFQAFRKHSSDIHIEHEARESHVRIRVDGILKNIMVLPRNIATGPLVSRIKIMANLDVANHLRPQDGRTMLRIGLVEVGLRVSILPTTYGEKVVMRILDPRSVDVPFEKLAFAPEVVAGITACINARQGMVLVTGPTGSGKTTTLYAALNKIKRESTNIVTVEDPIEYKLSGINQVQVNEKQGLTFAAVLRSVLRQDPDIIMVGEIRDHETADIAFQAAMTGHLVFSTLHTNDSVSTISRLADMGVDRFKIAPALLAIIAQRLVRRLCPLCAVKLPASGIPAAILAALAANGLEQACYRGTGCKNCDNSGYLGRTAVVELLIVDSHIKNLINSGAREEELYQSALASKNLRTMTHDALWQLSKGTTDLAEIMPYLSIRERTAGAPGPGWAADPALAGQPPAGRPAILIADDDPDIRAALSQYLVGGGYAVTAVPSGIAALLELGKKEYALVIADIDMPEVNGFQLLEVISRQGRRLPVILLTMLAGEEARAKGLRLGAADYILKSTDKAVLLASVQNVLNKSMAGRW